MIGTLKIRVQAANPQMPLQPIFTFKGSPSSLRILDVPKSIGKWNITKVYIKSNSPDNSLKIHDCVRQGSVWVGTIDGTEIVGKVKNGIEILANGIDENGSDVNGYVLGVGDYIVLERDSRITEKDIEKFYVKFVEQLPDNPNIGDTILDGGWLRIYDGQNWSEKPQIYVPTKVSQLENDKGFLTDKDIKPSTNPLYEGQGVAFMSEVCEWANYAEHITWTGINDKPEVLDSPENIATKNYVDTKIQNQPTITFSGEYEDGTTFSFDCITK